MNFATEIETLIRARYPILYVITSEEMRVQKILLNIATGRQKKVFEWTYSSGVVPAGTSLQSHKGHNTATKEPLAALDLVVDQVEPAIFRRSAENFGHAFSIIIARPIASIWSRTARMFANGWSSSPTTLNRSRSSLTSLA